MDPLDEERCRGPARSVLPRTLDNAVPFSKGIDLITLLAPDRRENTFSRLPSVRLLTYLVEFFERDIVKPIHCRRCVLYR